MFKQSTTDVPNAIGKIFSADVIRREGQKILVLIDIFSSFMIGQFVPNELHSTLQQMLIQLSANYKHSDGCKIKVDSAPGFLALRNDKLLGSIGIRLDFGRVKNKNKNAPVDKAVQEVELEIKRLAPEGGSISAGTLALAICNLNNRIRGTGLSAKEVITKRDSITDEPLLFEDEQLKLFRYNKRIQNHPHSEASKAQGGKVAHDALVTKGDVVHIKSEGSKHKAREFYLVTDVHYDKSEALIQKFCGSKLQSKRYLVKLPDVYPISSFSPITRENEIEKEEDDDVELMELSEQVGVVDETMNENILRRSDRNRKSPDWLATPEIQRVVDEK